MAVPECWGSVMSQIVGKPVLGEQPMDLSSQKNKGGAHLRDSKAGANSGGILSVSICPQQAHVIFGPIVFIIYDPNPSQKGSLVGTILYCCARFLRVQIHYCSLSLSQ